MQRPPESAHLADTLLRESYREKPRPNAHPNSKGRHKIEAEKVIESLKKVQMSIGK